MRLPRAKMVGGICYRSLYPSPGQSRLRGRVYQQDDVWRQEHQAQYRFPPGVEWSPLSPVWSPCTPPRDASCTAPLHCLACKLDNGGHMYLFILVVWAKFRKDFFQTTLISNKLHLSDKLYCMEISSYMINKTQFLLTCHPQWVCVCSSSRTVSPMSWSPCPGLPSPPPSYVAPRSSSPMLPVDDK